MGRENAGVEKIYLTISVFRQKILLFYYAYCNNMVKHNRTHARLRKEPRYISLISPHTPLIIITIYIHITPFGTSSVLIDLPFSRIRTGSFNTSLNSVAYLRERFVGLGKKISSKNIIAHWSIHNA